jgi:hypothetical protein
MIKKRRASIKWELIQKSREAALAAVQVFNNPLITFKSEMFIVNTHIAWTYLLHAYYREKKLEYRYIESIGPSGKRKFSTTKSGAHKYWSLEDCLHSKDSPIDKNTSNNLYFLIGLRHEIEHQMTTRIDDALSARFQACCLNFNTYIKELFGDIHGIDKHLAFSLQFTSLNDEQVQTMQNYSDILPNHVFKYVKGYDDKLSDDEFNSSKYAYRVLFTQKTVNKLGQADKVIEFIKPETAAAKGINTTYALIKEKEKNKYGAKKIVSIMNNEGYKKFNVAKHTSLWKTHKAKEPGKGYGTQVERSWFWYDTWLNVVRQHCSNNKRKYKP